MNYNNNSHCISIAETNLYMLFKEFEDVFLIEKSTNKELWRTSLYGEAECGIISNNDDWVIVAGEIMVLWQNENLEIIDDDDLKWILDIRQIGAYEIEILIDPWSENSAIWKFNLLDKSKIKIRNFNEYKGKKHTNDVKW